MAENIQVNNLDSAVNQLCNLTEVLSPGTFVLGQKTCNFSRTTLRAGSLLYSTRTTLTISEGDKQKIITIAAVHKKHNRHLKLKKRILNRFRKSTLQASHSQSKKVYKSMLGVNKSCCSSKIKYRKLASRILQQRNESNQSSTFTQSSELNSNCSQKTDSPSKTCVETCDIASQVSAQTSAKQCAPPLNGKLMVMTADGKLHPIKMASNNSSSPEKLNNLFLLPVSSSYQIIQPHNGSLQMLRTEGNQLYSGYRSYSGKNQNFSAFIKTEITENDIHHVGHHQLYSSTKRYMRRKEDPHHISNNAEKQIQSDITSEVFKEAVSSNKVSDSSHMYATSYKVSCPPVNHESSSTSADVTGPTSQRSLNANDSLPKIFLVSNTKQLKESFEKSKARETNSSEVDQCVRISEIVKKSIEVNKSQDYINDHPSWVKPYQSYIIYHKGGDNQVILASPNCSKDFSSTDINTCKLYSSERKYISKSVHNDGHIPCQPEGTNAVNSISTDINCVNYRGFSKSILSVANDVSKQTDLEHDRTALQQRNTSTENLLGNYVRVEKLITTPQQSVLYSDCSSLSMSDSLQQSTDSQAEDLDKEPPHLKKDSSLIEDSPKVVPIKQENSDSTIQSLFNVTDDHCYFSNSSSLYEVLCEPAASIENTSHNVQGCKVSGKILHQINSDLPSNNLLQLENSLYSSYSSDMNSHQNTASETINKPCDDRNDFGCDNNDKDVLFPSGTKDPDADVSVSAEKASTNFSYVEKQSLSDTIKPAIESCNVDFSVENNNGLDEYCQTIEYLLDVSADVSKKNLSKVNSDKKDFQEQDLNAKTLSSNKNNKNVSKKVKNNIVQAKSNKKDRSQNKKETKKLPEDKNIQQNPSQHKNINQDVLQDKNSNKCISQIKKQKKNLSPKTKRKQTKITFQRKQQNNNLSEDTNSTSVSENINNEISSYNLSSRNNLKNSNNKGLSQGLITCSLLQDTNNTSFSQDSSSLTLSQELHTKNHYEENLEQSSIKSQDDAWFELNCTSQKTKEAISKPQTVKENPMISNTGSLFSIFMEEMDCCLSESKMTQCQKKNLEYLGFGNNFLVELSKNTEAESVGICSKPAEGTVDLLKSISPKKETKCKTSVEDKVESPTYNVPALESLCTRQKMKPVVEHELFEKNTEETSKIKVKNVKNKRCPSKTGTRLCKELKKPPSVPKKRLSKTKSNVNNYVESHSSTEHSLECNTSPLSKNLKKQSEIGITENVVENISSTKNFGEEQSVGSSVHKANEHPSLETEKLESSDSLQHSSCIFATESPNSKMKNVLSRELADVANKNTHTVEESIKDQSAHNSAVQIESEETIIGTCTSDATKTGTPQKIGRSKNVKVVKTHQNKSDKTLGKQGKACSKRTGTDSKISEMLILENKCTDKNEIEAPNSKGKTTGKRKFETKNKTEKAKRGSKRVQGDINLPKSTSGKRKRKCKTDVAIKEDIPNSGFLMEKESPLSSNVSVLESLPTGLEIKPEPSEDFSEKDSVGKSKVKVKKAKRSCKNTKTATTSRKRSSKIKSCIGNSADKELSLQGCTSPLSENLNIKSEVDITENASEDINNMKVFEEESFADLIGNSPMHESKAQKNVLKCKNESSLSQAVTNKSDNVVEKNIRGQLDHNIAVQIESEKNKNGKSASNTRSSGAPKRCSRSKKNKIEPIQENKINLSSEKNNESNASSSVQDCFVSDNEASMLLDNVDGKSACKKSSKYAVETVSKASHLNLRTTLKRNAATKNKKESKTNLTVEEINNIELKINKQEDPMENISDVNKKILEFVDSDGGVVSSQHDFKADILPSKTRSAKRKLFENKNPNSDLSNSKFPNSKRKKLQQIEEKKIEDNLIECDVVEYMGEKVKLPFINVQDIFKSKSGVSQLCELDHTPTSLEIFSLLSAQEITTKADCSNLQLNKKSEQCSNENQDLTFSDGAIASSLTSFNHKRSSGKKSIDVELKEQQAFSKMNYRSSPLKTLDSKENTMLLPDSMNSITETNTEENKSPITLRSPKKSIVAASQPIGTKRSSRLRKSPQKFCPDFEFYKDQGKILRQSQSKMSKNKKGKLSKNEEDTTLFSQSNSNIELSEQCTTSINSNETSTQIDCALSKNKETLLFPKSNIGEADKICPTSESTKWKEESLTLASEMQLRNYEEKPPSIKECEMSESASSKVTCNSKSFVEQDSHFNDSVLTKNQSGNEESLAPQRKTKARFLNRICSDSGTSEDETLFSSCTTQPCEGYIEDSKLNHTENSLRNKSTLKNMLKEGVLNLGKPKRDNKLSHLNDSVHTKNQGGSEELLPPLRKTKSRFLNRIRSDSGASEDKTPFNACPTQPCEGYIEDDKLNHSENSLRNKSTLKESIEENLLNLNEPIPSSKLSIDAKSQRSLRRTNNPKVNAKKCIKRAPDSKIEHLEDPLKFDEFQVCKKLANDEQKSSSLLQSSEFNSSPIKLDCNSELNHNQEQCKINSSAHEFPVQITSFPKDVKTNASVAVLDSEIISKTKDTSAISNVTPNSGRLFEEKHPADTNDHNLPVKQNASPKSMNKETSVEATHVSKHQLKSENSKELFLRTVNLIGEKNIAAKNECKPLETELVKSELSSVPEIEKLPDPSSTPEIQIPAFSQNLGFSCRSQLLSPRKKKIQGVNKIGLERLLSSPNKILNQLEKSDVKKTPVTARNRHALSISKLNSLKQRHQKSISRCNSSSKTDCSNLEKDDSINQTNILSAESCKDEPVTMDISDNFEENSQNKKSLPLTKEKTIVENIKTICESAYPTIHQTKTCSVKDFYNRQFFTNVCLPKCESILSDIVQADVSNEYKFPEAFVEDNVLDMIKGYVKFHLPLIMSSSFIEGNFLSLQLVLDFVNKEYSGVEQMCMLAAFQNQNENIEIDDATLLLVYAGLSRLFFEYVRKMKFSLSD